MSTHRNRGSSTSRELAGRIVVCVAACIACTIALIYSPPLLAQEEEAVTPHRPSTPLGLTMTWAELPGREPTALEKLELELRHGGNETLELNFDLLTRGLDGRQAARSLGVSRLLPDGDLVLAVDLADLPIQSVGSVSQAWIEVSATGEDRNIRSIFSEPFFYEFDRTYREVTVFNQELASEHFLGLGEELLFDLEGRVFDGRGGYTDIGELIDGGGKFVIPKPSKWDKVEELPWPKWKPEPQDLTQGVSLCGRWTAHFVDAGFGEDHLKFKSMQKVPASYALGSVTKLGNTQPIWAGTLDELGCAPILNLYPGSYVFRHSSIIEGPAGENFTILHTPVNPDYLEPTPISYAAVIEVVQEPVEVIQAWVDPVAQGPISNVGAIVSHLLARPDHGIVPGSYTVFADKGCPSQGLASDSCAYPSAVYIGPGKGGAPHHSEWKYIVAHELGHMIQRRAMGSLSNDYALIEDPTSALCRCDHVTVANSLHCLQSLEDTSSAQLEGFAQFYAAMAFNTKQQSDCTFVYYKEFMQPMSYPLPFTVLFPPVGRDCTAPAQWRNECTQIADTGTEFDWMNFFWEIYEQSTMDDIFDIYKSACGGVKCYNADLSWQELVAGAEAHYGVADPAFQHFVAAGGANVVDD